MSRILFLAYHFPPIGGAGVQRNAKFARFLPEFGHECVVITGPGGSDDRWTPTDETLNNDIPDGTTVIRIPGPEPARSGRWRARAERFFALETPWLKWWNDGVVQAASQIGGEFDLVYASLVPYESAKGAERVARLLGKPWIVDLQDPWALDEMMVFPTELQRQLSIRQMRRALRAADGIVMNTPESQSRVLERFPELRSKPVVSITNGFDGDDFAHAIEPRDDNRFRIVHTGYLHTELGKEHRTRAGLRKLLGGVMNDVDILTRSHIYLLEAINQLVAEEPELAREIELVLAGVQSSADREAVDESSLVEFLGYRPHHETVALMQTADLLFLPMQNLPPGRRVGIVPGKTYEYLASKTPILAAVPEGDVRDILNAAGNAFVCRPDDVAAMAGILRAQIERKRAGLPAPPQDPWVVERFERRRLTEELSSLFDALSAPRRAPRLQVVRSHAEGEVSVT
jgi:glycosyltransferase involved in cell wall biosynthesis